MRTVFAFCFVLVSCKRQEGKIERLYWCLVQQKTLQTLQGSAINKIPNIPQCTLPPRPMCQTLLFDFSRVWFRDYFVCANRQIRLLSCMTCSLVPMQSSTCATIVACSTECSTNNASHRYSYCKRRQLRWKTGYEATILHSCLWFPGNFPTKKKKKEPADRL